MMEQVYKKVNLKTTEKYLYFSASSLDRYSSKPSNLIKNYIIVPDYKILKENSYY